VNPAMWFLKWFQMGFQILFVTGWVFFMAPLSASGQDMRELQLRAESAKSALLQKAAAEAQAAREEAASSKARIMSDRSALEAALGKLENEVGTLHKTVTALEAEDKTLLAQEEELSQQLARTDSVVRELVGVVRINAKDIDSLVAGNLQTALSDTSTQVLDAIAQEARFPGMAEIEKMIAILWEQIHTSGEVRVSQGHIIDRAGSRTTADILLLGNFNAAYRKDGEVGFLNYLPASRKLFALSRQPSGRMQKQLLSYMAGDSEAVPIDISRGGALSQLTHQLRLWEQIPKGGPLVWPILAILALGILIVGERIVFLLRKKMNADELTHRIAALAADQNWEDCRKSCSAHGHKPVARVVSAGLACCHMGREAMENALQEAILREIPPMERFLSTLGMLAAIAPLLGLLGTVTGMIDTFHVITQHGTGDPRMMSGGISEALVTTMLGLSVAIPIMLSHTLLHRAVDTQIHQMEEKSVALVNIVHKSRDEWN
jgi:biopolymer transport protein ExbB